MKQKTQNNRSSTARTMLGLFLLFVFMLAVVLLRITLVVTGKSKMGDLYYNKAVRASISDNRQVPRRGRILAANGEVLAYSSISGVIVFNPLNLSKYPTRQDRAKGAVDRADEISRFLADTLGVEYDKVYAATQLSAGAEGGTYSKLGGVYLSNEQRELVRDFIYERKNGKYVDSMRETFMHIDDEERRIYPYGNLASNVIGLRPSADGGGVEQYYYSVLSGSASRVVRSKSSDVDLFSKVETYEGAQASDVVLTLDVNVQKALEDTLRRVIVEDLAENVYGIVMDTDDFSIKGMCSLPDFDRENNSVLTLPHLEQLVAEEVDRDASLTPEEREKKINTIIYGDAEKGIGGEVMPRQWSNGCVSRSYSPGSVFKIATVAAALDSGTVTEDYSFDGCYDGASATNENGVDFHCWTFGKYSAHGHQTVRDLLKNSCNLFAINLALKMGTSTFYDYFEGFGFTENTGFDGGYSLTPTKSYNDREGSSTGGAIMARGAFARDHLYSYSFGSTFDATPMTVIDMAATVANDGYLMTPHIMGSLRDADGNTTQTWEPEVRRQVISKTTADKVTEFLREVVTTGTGVNADVPGYRIAGKTGTADKEVSYTLTDAEGNKTRRTAKEYAVSFCGMAPADDPKYALLIVIDKPHVENHSASTIAATVAGELFEKILPLLGVEPVYSEDEKDSVPVRMNDYIGYSVYEAQSALEAEGFSVIVRGDGPTVATQRPEGMQIVSRDSTVFLCSSSEDVVYTEVPDYTGMSLRAAENESYDNNLNMVASGYKRNGAIVISQSVAAGTKVPEGTLIELTMRNSEVSE